MVTNYIFFGSISSFVEKQPTVFNFFYSNLQVLDFN
jgi:hypothetical protein